VHKVSTQTFVAVGSIRYPSKNLSRPTEANFPFALGGDSPALLALVGSDLGNLDGVREEEFSGGEFEVGVQMGTCGFGQVG